MKKISTLLMGVALLSAISCKKGEDPTPEPTPTPTPSNLVELSGNLETMTLDASKKYLIKGTVFVNDGKVLTIPAGTVLMGDKKTKGTLVINVGGKIMAEGTATKPIIFTSKNGPGERDKGDWGGVILLGRANVNQNNPSIEGISPAVYFGSFQSSAHDNESSGVMKYVRIEYAGIALSPNNETNSLTFGAVGSGTVIENVQASYGGDDSFEWFGGTVNCKNLIAFAGWDDDFDTDFGYSGKVQFGLAVRDPFLADQSGSNGFESDNDAGGNDVTPYTSAVFSNMTVIGPRYDSTASISGNFQNAMHIRRRSSLSIFNSVITGFPVGLLLDGSVTKTQFDAGNGVLKNNVLAVVGNGKGKAAEPYKGASGVTAADAKAYWEANSNLTYTSNSSAIASTGLDLNFFVAKNSTYPANPNFVAPAALSTGADFTHTKLSGGFFATTTFKGAFGTTDWTDGWAEFNPQDKAY